jgi:hypothetical protein
VASRRRPTAADVPLMPRELLEPRNRDVRRQWLEHFGLTTRERQAAAVARAREEHGRDLDAPDPRELLRGLTNDSTKLRRKARP